MNIKTRYLAAVAASIFLPGAYLEAAGTGNELLDKCIHPSRYVDGGEYTNRYSIGYCFGFIESFVATSVFSTVSMQPLYICFPFKEKFATKQLVRILVKYMKDHPEQLHESAVGLVARAFNEAFPCNDENAPD